MTSRRRRIPAMGEWFCDPNIAVGEEMTRKMVIDGQSYLWLERACRIAATPPLAKWRMIRWLIGYAELTGFSPRDPLAALRRWEAERSGEMEIERVVRSGRAPEKISRFQPVAESPAGAEQGEEAEDVEGQGS
jgi:hypothetical protein